MERDAGRKAHRTFAGFSEIETGLSQINDPKQGARLVRAFPADHRPYASSNEAIVQMVENVGSAPADRIEISRSKSNDAAARTRAAEAAPCPAGRRSQVEAPRLPRASARHRQS